jgi:aminoglycoside phosphotransferase (APT) family kinase protein
MVLRRHGDADFDRNLNVARDEYRLLHLLRSAGVPVPTPFFLDTSGEIFPRPYLVVEYVEGSVDAAPSNVPDLVAQMATQLAAIHALDAETHDLSFLPGGEERPGDLLKAWPAGLDWLDEGRIRAALESAPTLSPRNKPVLLHGDFWPGNILWRDGRLAAVVDWEDAAVGDPLIDLANSRLELLWALGAEGMERFTHDYAAITSVDLTHLSTWDLWAALRSAPKIGGWGLDEAIEQAMRERLCWFVTQALEPTRSS